MPVVEKEEFISGISGGNEFFNLFLCDDSDFKKKYCEQRDDKVSSVSSWCPIDCNNDCDVDDWVTGGKSSSSSARVAGYSQERTILSTTPLKAPQFVKKLVGVDRLDSIERQYIKFGRRGGPFSKDDAEVDDTLLLRCTVEVKGSVLADPVRSSVDFIIEPAPAKNGQPRARVWYHCDIIFCAPKPFGLAGLIERELTSQATCAMDEVMVYKRKYIDAKAKESAQVNPSERSPRKHAPVRKVKDVPAPHTDVGSWALLMVPFICGAYCHNSVWMELSNLALYIWEMLLIGQCQLDSANIQCYWLSVVVGVVGIAAIYTDAYERHRVRASHNRVFAPQGRVSQKMQTLVRSPVRTPLAANTNQRRTSLH